VETNLTANVPGEPPEPFMDAPVAIGDVLLDGWSVAEIHRGGQAWVLVVDDNKEGNRRAIKVPLSGTLAGDGELVILLGLDPHPHVVTALDVTEVGGRRGLVLEHAPTTLADLLRRQRLDLSLQFPGRRRADSVDTSESPEQILRPQILQEICDGMAYLSEVDEFAHLDLKPSNVLIDSAGRAKIADFGLTQQVRTSDGRYSSASGGTWAYAAPEVIRQERCDSRADIFSFGVLLYQACTGKLPYPFLLASAPASQRAQLLDYYESPDSQSRTEKLLYFAPPNDVASGVISSCLQKNMTERPPSFRDLAQMITEQLRIPHLLGRTIPLPESDRQRREFALAQALVRMGRFDDAVRRLNRLLCASLPPMLFASVLHATQEALTAAGRQSEAAALEGWQ
jgi:serine/threonine protein kinase